jgi:hypothetical protein
MCGHESAPRHDDCHSGSRHAFKCAPGRAHLLELLEILEIHSSCLLRRPVSWFHPPAGDPTSSSS